jgi:hypothetical protein
VSALDEARAALEAHLETGDARTALEAFEAAVRANERAGATRAALLREVIDVAREEGHRLEAEAGIEPARGARCVAYLLRQLLIKAQP